MLPTLLLVVAAALMPNALASAKYFPGPAAPDRHVQSNSVTFAALGGWGRIGAAGLCLAGKTDECYGATEQLRTAWYMNEVCGLKDCEFIVSAGDNFYPKGVTTPEGEKGRLASDWEHVYQTKLMSHLEGLDWNIATGNHDHQGNYAAELYFPRLNPKWIMPGPFYVQDVYAGDTTVRILLIDTVSFVTNLTLLADDAFPGYNLLDTKQIRDYQLQFMETALSTSTATWNVVIAHHPFFGTTDSYALEDKEGFTAPLAILQKYKVPVVISGHDHVLALSDVNNTAFVTSGGGSLCQPGDGCTLDPADPNACPSFVKYISANATANTCNTGVVTVTASPKALTIEMWSFANASTPVYQPSYTATFNNAGKLTTSAKGLLPGAGTAQ